jgi:hypothetical protein
MKRVKRDDHREERIDMEILVDAYTEEERAMGWYYYLADTVTFPFQATCVQDHHKSPLEEHEMVEVLDLSPENTCLREIYVDVQRNGQQLSVPLAQLKAISADEDTQEALDDWHYWVGRGYGF